MEEESKTTEWALLFPLKAGLFPFKSSTVINHSVPNTSEPNKGNMNLQRDSQIDGKVEEPFPTVSNPRMKMRRRSSMSDIDKFTSSIGRSPELARYAGSNNTPNSYHHLRVSGDGYDSMPHSPGTPRRSNTPDIGACGSIGDLMNMKRYGGSSWSVRSCTETIIAKTVPLSTVTPRGSAPPSPLEDHKQQPELPRIEDRDSEQFSSSENVEDEETEDDSGPPPKLTCSQRTERLSRLIRQQRASIFVHTPRPVCCIRMKRGVKDINPVTICVS
ncbi:hypothetical protein B7P43_G03530 [Cryptotermes secundus]|uniref:Uncharacterized protein n=1 Tax=Cryptotermes secundus TaxID=105785 RepID=A0A2J7R518_9NEOP|nr:hypothetical protein B7P43_G03530 [Cryptotermes secundus]